MLSFTKFLTEEQQEEQCLAEDAEFIMEKLITFGGKAYPKFGNVVILAGGGSGKGFVQNKLMGIEGRAFDVDALKSLAAKTTKIRKRVMDEYGKDLAVMAADLKNPDNVYNLHVIVGDELKIPKKREAAFFTSILAAKPERKPNIIFDVTLKDMRKLDNITRAVTEIGYEKKNIHIVWVVNDIEVAIAQNERRARQVPREILIGTHRGASQTMADILNMGLRLQKYMDGDIVLAFNKINVDSEMAASGKGGSYMKTANYVYVKRAGKTPVRVSDLEDDIKRKIAQYVPKNTEWV